MTTPGPLELWFRFALIRWEKETPARDLPWKGETDPYRIWLSEIILQQTRSEQGRPYYERFLSAYPTVRDLAAAPDEEVFRHWQGLGYYNRCRNLLRTARLIAANGGRFPEQHAGLIALPGVGAYTAAAIASFAFGLPHAVVDGNVYRVLSRFFAIAIETDSAAGKQYFAELAARLLDPASPAAYNSAIMDLGATICLPRNPRCKECPLQAKCAALALGKQHAFPVKGKKTAVRDRYLHYILIERDGELWVRRRTAGIWRGLFEPVLVEGETGLERDDPQIIAASGLPGQAAPEFAGTLRHQLTHQRLHIRFFLARNGTPAAGEEGQWLPFKVLASTAFPRPLVVFFEKNVYF